MYDLRTLAQQIIAVTGIPTRIALDKSPELRVTSTDPAYVLLAYDRVMTLKEEDVLADTASEVGNSLFFTTKVSLFARPEQYPLIWLKVYQACLHFEPVFPSPAYQPLTFTFVNCEFYEDGGMWASVFTFGYSFDRFWEGGLDIPSAFDPLSLYGGATVSLP